MDNNDKIILKETLYVASFTAALSIILQIVFLAMRKWDFTVLTGNLLSGIFSVLNFYLMASTIKKSVGKEEKEIKKSVMFSQSGRMFMLFAVAAVGAYLPIFNIWATLIPLLFPRISMYFRNLFKF